MNHFMTVGWRHGSGEFEVIHPPSVPIQEQKDWFVRQCHEPTHPDYELIEQVAWPHKDYRSRRFGRLVVDESKPKRRRSDD